MKDQNEQAKDLLNGVMNAAISDVANVIAAPITLIQGILLIESNTRYDELVKFAVQQRILVLAYEKKFEAMIAAGVLKTE